jgi:hypothetical protein
MIDHDNRIAALEAEVAELKRRMDHEKAGRLALQQIVIPPLDEVRKDLQLNVDYLTQRLEQLKARPAVGSNDEAGDDIAELYRGSIQLLKWLNRIEERLGWLVDVVMRDIERQARAMGIPA